MFMTELEIQTREHERRWERRHPHRIDPEKAAMYEELLELVEMAEKAANDEVAALGSYDAIPNCVEAFGVHGAIETQVAGAFGVKDEWR